MLRFVFSSCFSNIDARFPQQLCRTAQMATHRLQQDHQNLRVVFNHGVELLCSDAQKLTVLFSNQVQLARLIENNGKVTNQTARLNRGNLKSVAECQPKTWIMCGIKVEPTIVLRMKEQKTKRQQYYCTYDSYDNKELQSKPDILNGGWLLADHQRRCRSGLKARQ